jgi:hypothetical protein
MYRNSTPTVFYHVFLCEHVDFFHATPRAVTRSEYDPLTGGTEDEVDSRRLQFG